MLVLLISTLANNVISDTPIKMDYASPIIVLLFQENYGYARGALEGSNPMNKNAKLKIVFSLELTILLAFDATQDMI